MTKILAAILGLFVATSAMAETSVLRSFVTGDDSRGWEGVGRLNIAGEAFCTGALISETLVLTAAHCLFDTETGEQYPADRIEFLAGWRNGRASAYRAVRRVVVNPDYDFLGEDKTSRVAADVAILELDTAVRNGSVAPFDIGMRPRKGDEVGVVSYAHDRADSPSIQETCKVLARQQGALVTNCDVDHGSSGAPIFVIQDGAARIVSVVSAKAHVGDIPVSLGASLGEVIDAMRAELATTDEYFTPVSASLPQVSRRESGAANTAKFVRPGGS